MLSNFGNVTDLLNQLELQSFKFYKIQNDAVLTQINKDEMMALPHCDVVITRDKL